MDYVIKHESLFSTSKLEQLYTEKDGVPVKYVCTSALGPQTFAADIFYRETPHPEFGNHYFGVYSNQYAGGAMIMIANADKIEDLEFGMVKDSDGNLHYSSHRHDYKVTDAGNMIDGGRAYIKRSGDVTIFEIRNGEFYVRT